MQMILYRNGIATIHYCPSQTHWLAPPKVPTEKAKTMNPEAIISYYSFNEAIKAGWKVTDDIMFCPPDKQYVWVCPKCAKKLEWRNKNG